MHTRENRFIFSVSRCTLVYRWRLRAQVAMVVDRVLLLVFTTTTLAITAAILLHAPLSRDFLFGSDFTVDLAGTGSGGVVADSDNQTSNASSAQ